MIKKKFITACIVLMLCLIEPQATHAMNICSDAIKPIYLEEPIIRINNIMRKYHQNNIPHTQQDTSHDIMLLQDIMAKTTNPAIQNDLINEIINNCLFKFFHTHHHKETLLYIDDIITNIPEINAKLIFYPHKNLNANPLYNTIKTNWDTLSASQRLIFHILLSNNNLIYFFDSIKNYSPQEALDRLKIFKSLNILPYRKINSINAYNTFIQNVICIQSIHSSNHKKIWEKFNKTLDTQKTLFAILADTPLDPYFTPFETIITLSKKTNTVEKINHLYASLVFGSKNAYEIFRKILSTNDPEYTIILNDKKKQNVLVNDLKIPDLDEATQKKIIFRAFINGNDYCLQDIVHAFPLTAPAIGKSKELFNQANLYDRPLLSQKIKNLIFATSTTQEQLQFNYDKPLFPNLINASILKNAQEMHELTQSCYQDALIFNKTTFAKEAISKDVQEQTISLLEEQKIQTALLGNIQNDLAEAIKFLHIKITPILSTSQITNDIIEEYNNICTKLYNNNQDSYANYLIFCEELYGILLYKIFFTTPQKASLDTVDALINSLQKSNVIQPTLSKDTQAIAHYIKLHPHTTLRPHEIFVINTLDIYSHFFTYVKHDIATFIQFIPYYYISNNKIPFFTQKMFNQDMLELEELAAQQNLSPCHLDYSEAQEAYNYSPMCVAALLGDLYYLKNSTFAKEPKPIQEQITLCALNGENSDTMLYCLKHLLCRDHRSEFNKYDMHACNKDKIHRNIVIQCYLNNKTDILEKFSKKFYSMNYHTNSMHYETIFTPYLKSDFNPHHDPKRHYIINKVPHAENIISESKNMALEAELKFNKKIYSDCQKITNAYGLSYLKKMIILGDPSFFDNYNFPGYKSYILNLTLCAIAGPNENILDFFLDLMFTHTFDEDPTNPSNEKVIKKIVMQAFFYHKPNVLDKLINKYKCSVPYTHLYPHTIADMEALKTYIYKNPPNLQDKEIIKSMFTCAQNTHSAYALIVLHTLLKNHFNSPMFDNNYPSLLLQKSCKNQDPAFFQKALLQCTNPIHLDCLAEEETIREAILHNRIDIIKESLKEGFSINKIKGGQAQNNITLYKRMLLCAIMSNRIEITKLFLNHNAITLKHEITLFLNRQNMQLFPRAKHLIKTLFKKDQFDMLNVLFDYIHQEENKNQSENLFLFFYYATQNTTVFTTWFNKLNNNEKEKLQAARNTNIISQKIKNRFATISYLSMDIFGAACLHQNNDLINYFISHSYPYNESCALLFALYNKDYQLLKKLITYIFSCHQFLKTQIWIIKTLIDELATNYIYTLDDFRQIIEILTTHDAINITKDLPITIFEIIKKIQKESPNDPVCAKINICIKYLVENMYSMDHNFAQYSGKYNTIILNLAASHDTYNYITTTLFNMILPQTNISSIYNSPIMRSVLNNAIMYNNTTFIQAFLQKYPFDIDTPNPEEDNDTLLLYAVAILQFDVITFLLQNHANPYLNNNKNLNPYILLQMQKNKLLQKTNPTHEDTNKVKKIDDLIEYIKLSHPQSLAMIEQCKTAIAQHDYATIQNILAQGFPILDNHEHYRNLFLTCVNEQRDLTIVTILCSLYKLDTLLSIKDSNGNSMLTNAVYRYDIPLIDLITSHPDYKESFEKMKDNAIFIAIQKGHYTIVEKIIGTNNPALNKNYHDKNLNTPLHAALLYNQQAIAHYLIDNEKKLGLSNNEFNSNHITPLMYAIEHDMHDIVAKLQTIKNPWPYLEKRDKSGQSILYHAAKNDYIKTIRHCLQSSCPHLAVNYQTPKNAMTALHAAAQAGKEHAVKILLEQGAQKNIPNKKNQTPLDLAKKKKFKNIEQLLA